MVFEWLAKILAYLQANGVIVAAVMTATEWIKLQLVTQPWIKSWHFTLIAFILAFVFVIPSGGFVFSLDWVLQGLAVGGVATGIFKTVKETYVAARDIK